MKADFRQSKQAPPGCRSLAVSVIPARGICGEKPALPEEAMNRRSFVRNTFSAVASWSAMRSGTTPASWELARDPARRACRKELVEEEAGGLRSRWIRPGPRDPRPVWGARGGILVGLWPADVEGNGDGGPRGLLRIGYPMIDGGKRTGLVNYIAVEPVVGSVRGFSELERSSRDGRPGLLFWTGDVAEPPAAPGPGAVRRHNGVERLQATIRTERFANGAQPIIELEVAANRPGELRMSVRSAAGSAPMAACVLTATMGNYGRLRRLWLRDSVVEAKSLWPEFTGEEFTSDRFFAEDRLNRMRDGSILVCATSDEPDPHAVPADPAGPGWAYRGSFPLTQYWRKPVDARGFAGLRVRVNGRLRYWATHNVIPGGIAFENFELVQPFYEGQSFDFGLSRRPPQDLDR
ncbi:MAG TPA: hypothetical protein VGS41_02960 [Chthonomonadales bacterium]|nr:hypothetical protein [Chthonomonadales bacterium]